jgi:hypothetical protein
VQYLLPLGSQRYICVPSWHCGSMHGCRLEENVKTDNGIHRLEDERPPLALRLLLGIRDPVNLQPSVV